MGILAINWRVVADKQLDLYPFYLEILLNRLIYSLLLALSTPLIYLYFISRGIKDRRYWRDLGQRLGFAPLNTDNELIHLHCASVGETRAALPLVRKLLSHFPEHHLLISTTTPTGKQEIQNFIQHIGDTRIQVTYLPIDWFGACKRFVKRVKPKLTLLIETEVWPNLIFTLSTQGIPIILANGRMSEAAMHKYLKFASFSHQFFSKINLVLAQYQEDSEHYLRLGVANSRIKTCGSIKYDLEISAQLMEQQQALKSRWCKDRPCWIAASIHPAEFPIVLSAHKALLKQTPDLLLIAVARHPERFYELKKSAMQESLNFVLRSQNQSPSQEHQLIIGDTMGELMQFYGAADVAFVGGSFIPHGGQNPIEPAACGLPVIMGPSFYNFSFVAEEMQHQGVLEILADGSKEAKIHHLAQAVSRKINDHQGLINIEKAARALFKKNQGAIEETLTSIENILK